MKFFHVYDERGFDGLVKNNFISEDTAFKIQHDYCMPDSVKFNRVAKKGSALHSLIREGNYPFYVDRLTGGLRYHPYVFNHGLIDEYRNLLGDWFLGFQQHETPGGRLADWRRIEQKAGDAFGALNTLQMQDLLYTPEYMPPSGVPMYYLTQGAPEEYACRPAPHDPESCMEDYLWLINRRMKETDGMLLICESGHLNFRAATQLGVKSLAPELGNQTPHGRIAVALARGLSRSTGVKWGTYYECWVHNGHTGSGYTKPVYNPESINEWYYTPDQFIDDFTTGGPNAGSSRLLQRRIYYYSLMSGAQFMSEEWEMNCNYQDFSTYELSEYGLQKKAFLPFAREHKQVEAITPFAIVLPTDYEQVQLFGFARSEMGTPAPKYMGFPICAQRAARIGRIEDLLKFVYRRDLTQQRGTESHPLQNSRFGDLFDIIYADAPEEAFARYDRLIDADPDGGFAQKMGGRLPVLRADDFAALEMELHKRGKEILPIYADNLHWLLSEDEKGRYITVLNNEGNTRVLGQGDFVDHQADATTTIYTKHGVLPKLIYASSEQVRLEKKNEGEYSLFIPATDLAILQY